MNIILEFKNISFCYGSTKVIDNFSLGIEEKKITTLLGPSGCGKTTLLRLVAGFLSPHSGEILISGISQKNIEPNKRSIAYVFQDYALFPHMDVRKNILYGLKKYSYKKDFIEYKFQQELRLLGLVGLENRYPHELSGGQQQRVALARSLIVEPKILLMDEPLSSLDTKLRFMLREELKELQQSLGITTVYVTHDQEEAMGLSDKIAVIDHGKLLQLDNAKKLYYEPKTKQVADFTGSVNYFGSIMVRSEWFYVDKKNKKDEKEFCGIVISKTFLGKSTRIKLQSKIALNGMFFADIDNDSAEKIIIGTNLILYTEKCVIF